MEDTTDAVICPTPGCGATLPLTSQNGVTVLLASFPDDLKQVNLLAAGGADYVYCRRCKELIPYQSVALCVIKPTWAALLYVPAEIAQARPDVLESLHQTFTQGIHDQVEGGGFEILTETLPFRRRLGHAIAALAGPLINGFTNAQTAGGTTAVAWVQENRERLDRAFFAGAYLLAEGSLAVSYGLTEEPLAPETTVVGAGDPRFLENYRVSQERAGEVIRDRLRWLLTSRLAQLVDQAVNERTVGTLGEAVVALVPPEVIDEPALEQLQSVLEGIEANGEVAGTIKYASHAAFAAICDLADYENPCSADWAGWYVGMELARRTGDEGDALEGLTVSTDFAARMIDPRDLWDQFALRMKQAQGRLDKTMLEAFDAIVRALGFEDQWSEYISERYLVNLDDVPEEKLDATLQRLTTGLRGTPGATIEVFQPVLQNLAARDPDRMRAYARGLRQDALDGGQWSDALWITCRMSELLNVRSLSRLALDEVRACIAVLEQAGVWPPEKTYDHVSLLTEEGNCLRYLGDRPAALERYEQIRKLMPEDLSIKNVRVNERNRAIVLREMGRFQESLSVFSRLLPHTREVERADTRHSIAACLVGLGNRLGALEMVQTALSELGEQAPGSRVRLYLLIALASLARAVPDPQMSLAAALEAHKVAEEQGSLWWQALALGQAAEAADTVVEDAEERRTLTDKAVQILRIVLDAPEAIAPNPLVNLHLRAMLADRLEAGGDLAGAARVLEETIRLYGEADLDQLWGQWVNLAHLARAQGDLPLARARLVEAQRAVLRAADRVELGSDPIGMMVAKDDLQIILADDFLNAYRENSVGVDGLRQIADFQASVLLSRQLAALNRGTGGADGAEVEGEAALRSLGRGGSTAGVAVLQTFETRSGFHLLLTRIGGDGGVHTDLLPWEGRHEDLIPLIRKTWGRLVTASPARSSDPLERFEAWLAVAGPLRAAVEAAVPPGTHLCLIPGALSGLPLQYVFGDAYPLNYAPSLSAACALRTRRLALAPEQEGARWRPRSLYDFVVWKVNETEAVREEFRSAADALRGEAEKKGVAYQRSEGVAGTREALFAALSGADCVRLSCHGKAREDALWSELLVAGEGQLPPGDPTALASESAAPFLVDWQALSAQPRSAPVVFSAACSSGLASSARGGERVGLERPLMRTGTLAYVAPQWPVPAKLALPLLNRIITAYLSDTTRTLSEVVFAETNAALAGGMPLRVARSIAVHGDWL